MTEKLLIQTGMGKEHVLGRSGTQLDTPSAAEGRLVTLNGLDLYYEVLGDGPPLQLHHSFRSSQAWGQPFKAHLAQAYRHKRCQSITA